MDEFDLKNISPMLFHEADEIFDSKDYLYELKFDGIRCLVYLDNVSTTLINKRFKDVSITYPELSEIHKNVKDKCVLDGELVNMEDGKPNFYNIQKRSLITDPLKIKLASAKHPVIFVAFDIIYLKDKLIVDLPLIERKQILKQTVRESNHLILTRFIEEKGIDFFLLAKKNDLEGIVAKEKTSKYYLGKRSIVWLKMKTYFEDDVVICGYVPNEYGIKDLILGRYNSEGNLERAATVMSAKNKREIINYARLHPSPPLFETNYDDVVWMKPHLVGVVQYMMKNVHGGLRQAVFKGLRDDLVASDLK